MTQSTDNSEKRRKRFRRLIEIAIMFLATNLVIICITYLVESFLFMMQIFVVAILPFSILLIHDLRRASSTNLFADLFDRMNGRTEEWNSMMEEMSDIAAPDDGIVLDLFAY